MPSNNMCRLLSAGLENPEMTENEAYNIVRETESEERGVLSTTANQPNHQTHLLTDREAGV